MFALNVQTTNNARVTDVSIPGKVSKLIHHSHSRRPASDNCAFFCFVLFFCFHLLHNCLDTCFCDALVFFSFLSEPPFPQLLSTSLKQPFFIKPNRCHYVEKKRRDSMLIADCGHAPFNRTVTRTRLARCHESGGDIVHALILCGE